MVKVQHMSDEAIWLRIQQIGSTLFRRCAEGKCQIAKHTADCDKLFQQFKLLTSEDARRTKEGRRDARRFYYQRLKAN